MEKMMTELKNMLMDKDGLKDNRGITLIELMVVVSVAGILIVALGFQYEGWYRRYRAENEVKELYTDIMNARTRAMSTNLTYFVKVGPGRTYRITEDTSGDGSFGAGDADLWPSPKKMAYAVENSLDIKIDTKGLVENRIPPAFPIQPVRVLHITGGKDFSPDYDCIALAQTRILLGKWEKCGGALDECCPK